MRKVLICMVTALAFPAAAQSETVTVVGCPERGVTGSCIVLKDGGTGTVYDITGASRRPPIGRSITLKGTVSGMATPCMQGTHLKDITWTTNKRRCSRPNQR